ncbi:MAG: hypothetical protein R6T93_08085 [Trueperaceae bacterium]
MRKLLASTFVLALLAVAIAAPPIDYELTCGEDLIGVLSLTEGKVHVALVEGAGDVECDAVDGVVVFIFEEDPELTVMIEWGDGQPVVTVENGAGLLDVDLIVVPQVAIDGMLDAQRLRAAAMEMRREAAERGETDRDRDRSSWDDEGAPGDGEPGGPPADVPPGDGEPGGPPDDAPRGDGTGEGPSGPPADVPPGEGQGPGSRP